MLVTKADAKLFDQIKRFDRPLSIFLPCTSDPDILSVNNNQIKRYPQIDYFLSNNTVYIGLGDILENTFVINNQLTILGFMCLTNLAIKHEFNQFIIMMKNHEIY